MATKRGLLTIALCAFAAQVFAQDDGLAIHVKLKPAMGWNPPDDRQSQIDLADLDVLLEVRRTQLDISQGIELVLTISNLSDDPISFLDPAYFIDVQVLNSSDQLVNLAHVPGPLSPLICRPRNSKIPPDLGERGAFRITNVELDDKGSQKEVPERAMATIDLVPDGYYRIALRITKILADPQERHRRLTQRDSIPVGPDGVLVLPPLSTVAIPAGKYKVKVLLALAFRAPGKFHAPLRSDFIEVSLGSN